MEKIKYTKGELKRQRDSLSQFSHYLPTLQLKKQQLQMKILSVGKILSQKQEDLAAKLNLIEEWVGLLSDPTVDLKGYIVVEKILTEKVNIAGASIDLFKGIQFKELEYDLYSTPFWIDQGIVALQEVASMLIEIELLKKQIVVLSRELRVTTQRVNLFEKVKIPECLENIRRIRIYLGDQQANAVGIGKVAKKKIETREQVGV